MSEYCVVLTTVGSEKEAKELIETVLREKLAACLQTVEIGSHYTWKGEVCHDREVLILFKTRWDLYDALERKLCEVHSYETPEIIAIDIERGSKAYLDWIDEVTERRRRREDGIQRESD